MDQEIIEMKVKGRGLAVTFFLKVPFVSEDNDYLQRHTAIADKKAEKKALAEYAIYSDALAAWSAQMPVIDTDEKDDTGEIVTKPMGEGSPSEAVQAFFAERTPTKERMAMSAVGAFRSELYPEVSFPVRSE